MAILFSARTDVGRVREQNEDNYLVDRSLHLYIVCDGMGGHLSGEVASATAVNMTRDLIQARREIIDTYLRSPEDNTTEAIHNLLKESVESASARIHERGIMNPEQRGMGTTLTALLLVGQRGFIAQVGDSRVYRIRGDEIEQLTEDHSLYNAMLQSGAQLDNEAALGRLKNAVTRAVGASPELEVDTFELDLLANDRFVLCSDGLSGYLDGAELLAVAREPDCDTAVEQLIMGANERGGRDNITAIIVQLPADDAMSTRRTEDDVCDIMRRSILGSGLSTRESDALRARLIVEEFPAGSRIFEAGSRGRELYLVVHGTLLLRADSGRTERLKAGEVIGETFLLSGGYHGATLEVSADGPSMVARLDRQAYHGLSRETPVAFARVAINLARQLSDRVGSFALNQSSPLWRYTDASEDIPMRRRDTVELPATDAEMTGQILGAGTDDTNPALDVRAVLSEAQPDWAVDTSARALEDTVTDIRQADPGLAETSEDLALSATRDASSFSGLSASDTDPALDATAAAVDVSALRAGRGDMGMEATQAEVDLTALRGDAETREMGFDPTHTDVDVRALRQSMSPNTDSDDDA